MPESVRQRVLDAAAVLQVRRSEVAARLLLGPTAGAEVVAVGMQGTNDYMLEASATWSELLSVRPAAATHQLRFSLPTNRTLLANGLQMVSAFDYDGLDLDGRMLLANEPVGDYLFCSAPVQMKIVDRRLVLLQGPEIGGEPSIMAVTASPCFDAAWRYWDAVVASSIPMDTGVGPHASLTPRQQQVVGLLLSDLGDDAVAATLGVSVRTVRSDVAAILEALGVKSRFAAGARLQLWASQHD